MRSLNLSDLDHIRWFEKILLGVYEWQDSNERELTAWVHENWLIEATILTVDELKELWTSSRDKNLVRKRNKKIEIWTFYSENIDILDKYLQNYEDENDTIIVLIMIAKRNLKRKCGQEEIYDEIIVE